MHGKVYFNVCGKHYETYPQTLDRFPGTILGTEKKRLRLTCNAQNIIHLNCSTRCFDAILFYYQSNGILSRPYDTSMEEFLTVCYQFRIDEERITYIRAKEGYFLSSQHSSLQLATNCQCLAKMRKFLDDPHYSTGAYVYAVLSLLLILISTVLNCVVSLPQITSKRTRNIKTDPWVQTEACFNFLFALELTLRFVVSAQKLKFTKDFFNIIDFVAVFPYLIVTAVTSQGASNVAFLKAFRTVRVLRLLRFSKHSHTLDTVLRIIANCMKDLIVLLLCLFLTCCISGSLEYFIENPTDNNFTSIPQSMWWALQTVVCLGYGDIVPKTDFGKFIGMVVAIFGAVTITIPLLSLGGHYLGMYTKTFRVALGPDLAHVWEYPIRARLTHSSEIISARRGVVRGLVSTPRDDTVDELKNMD